MAYVRIDAAAGAVKRRSLKQALLRGIMDMGYENKLESIIYPDILKKQTNHLLMPFNSISDEEKAMIYSTSIIESIDLSRGEWQAIIFGKSDKFLEITETTIECLSKHMELKRSSVYRLRANTIEKEIPIPQQGSILLGKPNEILMLVKTQSINMENLSWIIFDELEMFTVPEYLVIPYFLPSGNDLNIMHTSSQCFSIIIEMLKRNQTVEPPQEGIIEYPYQNCADSISNLKGKKKNLQKRKKSCNGHLSNCNSNECHNENCADSISNLKKNMKKKSLRKKKSYNGHLNCNSNDGNECHNDNCADSTPKKERKRRWPRRKQNKINWRKRNPSKLVAETIRELLKP